MSTVRRTSALYNAHFAQVTAVQTEHAAQFQALTEGLTPAMLAELRTRFDEDYSVETMEDALQLWSALERAVPFERFSDETFNAFSHAESLVESLHQVDTDHVEAELADFHSHVLTAMIAAEKEMGAYAQRATAEAIDLALHDLGYLVERADFDGVVTGFEASMANSKLVVEVTAGGEVVTDFVGLSDTASCGSAQEALVEKVSVYGVDLAEHGRHDHRDTRGGGLVQRVARASGRTLAQRIVSAHATTTASHTLASRASTSRATKKASE